MHKLIVKPAASLVEQDTAYHLALKVFKEQASMENYAELKSFMWSEDPSFTKENILLAWIEEELVGIIRIVPRTIYRGEETFSVAGISSVCISPEWQGKGLSKGLIEQSLNYCRDRNFDISFLFARRAVDYYYNQFGFYGIASYARVFIKEPLVLKNIIKFSVSGINHSLYLLYQMLYENSYHKCFGRIDRSEAYWKFLLTSLEKREDSHFYTIYQNSVAVGYVLASKTKITEIAVADVVVVNELISFLISSKIVICTDNKLEIEIPAQHSLISSCQGMDITFQNRECSYGGHMAKVLNINKLIGKLKQRAPLLAKELAGIEMKEILSYSETCSLLGVLSPTTGDNIMTEDFLPFDICHADHF